MAFGAGGEVRRKEFIEAGATQAEIGESLGDGEFLSTKAARDIPDKRGGVAQVELPMVFIPSTWPEGSRERTLASATAPLRLRPACANPPASAFDRTPSGFECPLSGFDRTATLPFLASRPSERCDSTRAFPIERRAGLDFGPRLGQLRLALLAVLHLGGDREAVVERRAVGVRSASSALREAARAQLGSPVPQPPLVPSASSVVIGVGVRAEQPHRHAVMGRALDLPAGEDARGIAVDEQAEQQARRIRRIARGRAR